MMKWILRALYIIFLVKFIFALMPSFQVDMGAWLGWAERLSSVGFSYFYSDESWTQYTPGFLYWLWFIGKLGIIHPLAIKIPVIFADMFTAYLMWKVIAKTSRRWANWLFILYTLSPVAILDGSIWGQVDGILTLAMFGSVYALVERQNYVLSAVLAGVALLIKPQAIAILPVLGIVMFVRFGLGKSLRYALLTFATALVGFYPFYPQNPLHGMIDLVHKMGISYPFTSLFAYNIWAYVGMWINDSTLWQGISYFSWGTILTVMAFLGLLYVNRNNFRDTTHIYLVFALSCFIFFLFPTRVHERYLFPMFAFLITHVGVTQSKKFLLVTIVSVLLYSANLYYPYSYYESVSNPLKNVFIEDIIERSSLYLASMQLFLFGTLWLLPGRENLKEKLPVTDRKMKAIKHGRDQK